MISFANFSLVCQDAEKWLRRAPVIHTERWQGFDISTRPEAQMRELIHYAFSVDLRTENLSSLASDIKPNLPWADKHFELERVSGEPINPGTTWKEWPYARSAERSLMSDGTFNHTYAERYYPRFARSSIAHMGILYRYGDLDDLVEHMLLEPFTRQAYLPIFFPEDTGIANPSRKPCSLGYHFLMRDDKLHITYYIRSCDFIRHFRDDIYLTVRLQLWVLNQLRARSEQWQSVKLGRFRMDIGSLHVFINDLAPL